MGSTHGYRLISIVPQHNTVCSQTLSIRCFYIFSIIFQISFLYRTPKICAAEKYLCEAPPTHQSSSLRTEKTPINKSPADDTTRVSGCVRRLSRLLCLALAPRADAAGHLLVKMLSFHACINATRTKAFRVRVNFVRNTLKACTK